MPRRYERDCDECGQHYRGEGKRYCSHHCAQNARRPISQKLPSPALDGDKLEVDIDGGTVTLLSTKAIKSPESLLEMAELGDTWELVPDSGVVKTWTTAMKIEGYPVHVPNYYVQIKIRKRWADDPDLPIPHILKITRPSAKPLGDVGNHSVHYSDIHFPHHDPRVVDILYQVLDLVNPHLVVDHGDTADCEQISKHPKDPFNRIGLREEVCMVSEHHGTVHSLTPRAEHLWLLGNHEDRIRRLIWKMAEDRRAGELLTLDPIRDALEWGSLTGVDALGWEIINYPKHKVLNERLILCHGEVAKGESGASERAEYRKYGKGGISGHTHRIGFFGRRDYNGVHGWWGLGCCCKIRDDYTSFPDWQQGFAVVTWNRDRSEYHVERVRIFDGVAYFRGIRLEGLAAN